MSIQVGSASIHPMMSGVDPVLANAPQAMATVEATTSEYRQAKEAKDAADAELMVQLDLLAPGLTEQQRQDYIQAYKEAHAEIYAAEAATAARLRDLVNGPQVDALAQGDPAYAAAVVDAVAALADSSQGQVALDWLDQRFGKEAMAPDNPAGEPYRSFLPPGRVDSIAGSAVQAVAVEAAQSDAPLEAIGNSAGALQRLVNAGVGTAALVAGMQLVTGTYDAGIRGNASLFQASFDRVYQSGGAGPKFEAAGYFLAGLLVADGLINGVGDSPEAKAKFLGDLAITLQGGAVVAGRMIRDGNVAFWNESSNLLRRVSILTNPTPAQIAGKSLVRIAPVLGGLAGAFYAVSDIIAFTKDPSLLTAASAIGNLMSVAFFFPGGQVIGLMGVGISAISAWIANGLATNLRKEEQQALLQGIGVDPALASTLIENPEAVRMLALNMSPEQVQQLAQHYPELLAKPENAGAFSAAVGEAGLVGDQIMGLADALAATEYGTAIFDELGRLTPTDSLMTTGYSGPQALAQMAGIDPGNGVATFLEHHAPGALDRISVRHQADEDSRLLGDQMSVSGMPVAGIEDGLRTLLSQSNDPVYRARIIENIVVSFALGSGTEQALVDMAQRAARMDQETEDPNMKVVPLLSQGIREAHAQGLISRELANQALAAMGQPVIAQQVPYQTAPAMA